MINKCLFPAAGYGTRFLPATKAVPKEMLPILTKPLLQYGVEEALTANITQMAIVTGRGKRAIEDHFDNSFELESQLSGTSKEFYLDEIKAMIEKATFTYVRQRQMLGLGHAILTGESLIGNEPFAVILADDLCDCSGNGVTSQLIKIYNKYQCSVIAIEEIPLTQIERYGVISGDLIDGTNNTYRVANMFEKPNSHDLIKFSEDKVDLNKAPSFMSIIGRYILTPDIFDILRNIKANKNGEIQITDALLAQAKQGRVVAHKIKGKRFDCGSVKGYLEAINHFAKKDGIS
ncbi:UTP--glucose-1-phosphate uridylyltransferase GalU [Candidatus Thioglobus sp.]|nr:UTP--glucose-1-phosphate uridylyltransferase GalU [Candidatus Thioglobus sp.]